MIEIDEILDKLRTLSDSSWADKGTRRFGLGINFGRLEMISLICSLKGADNLELILKDEIKNNLRLLEEIKTSE